MYCIVEISTFFNQSSEQLKALQNVNEHHYLLNDFL